MSDVGIKPQLPDTLDISNPKVQLGSKAPAPDIAVTNPPNVGGGEAEFSDVTGAIQQLVATKTAELNASMKALQANSDVDASASAQITGFQAKTLDAYENVQKTNTLPGGAGGHLAKIMGIFDSDYNINFQKTAIEENQLRAKSIADTAAAIKEQNNALPAILGKVSDAANTVFQAQKDANQLAINASTLKDKQLNTQISASRLRIEMSQEQRSEADFKIKGMTTAQLQTELPRANAGKGPLAGLGGLIEDRLTTELTAQTNLDKANLELKKGNREEYNNSMADVVQHLPVDFTQAALQEAQASGAPVVSLNLGQIDPTTKKPIATDIPIDIVQKGITANLKTQDEVNQAVAADLTQKLNVIPTMTNLMNTSNAFASIDSRSTQIATQLASVATNMDAKNPQSVSQTGKLLDSLQKQMDGIVKDNAAKFSTKESQAAVISYGKTGKFDTTGGTAVVADSIGIPSLSVNTLYKDAFKTANNLLAAQIKKQNLSGTAGLDPSNQADAQQILAQMLAGKGSKEKIGQITAEIMADPTAQKQMADSVKGTIQGRSVMRVLQQLSSGKGANPLWGEILGHPEQFRDANGKPSPALLFQKMEQQSVLSGSKIDYSSAFLEGLRNYAVNSDNTSSVDPAYTLQDHALEASLFGGNPSQAVLGDLHYQLRQLSAQAHAEMQARIQQDVSGATVRQAINNAAAVKGLTDTIQLIAGDPLQILKKLGVDVNQVPSATGVTGLTAAQVKAQHGGGQ